ncbi:MAG: hypothetical protein VZR00_08430 [Lachnospiraceae bacterium]|jgi:hypothetical protein|nr:hypothetical protein [Lachnospiraceae bacterium]MEE3461894.1 hypothetical protein [Lachnospiraceae bacterium]
MNNLFIIRKYIQNFYAERSVLINYVIRFIYAAFSLLSIDMLAGYNPYLTSPFVIILTSVILTFLPVQVTVFAAAAFAVANIYYVSLLLALALALISMTGYLVYLRFDTETGIIAGVLIILYVLKIPYLIPIAAGLFLEPAASIPVMMGVMFYHMLLGVSTVISASSADNSISFTAAMNEIFTDKSMYVEMIIFVFVMLITYLIRSVRMKYSYEIAVFAGFFSSITLFLITNFSLDIATHPAHFLIENAVSLLLAYVALFFRFTLNYLAVENLQFEDEDYVYYVRAVPKMNISMKERRVRKFGRGFKNLRESREKEEEEKEETW